MGTTAASLHLVVPPGAAGNQSAALLKAYAKIGWAPPKRGEAGQRNVVLARNDASFVSIYDSDCAELDDGTLKELAAMLSKSLRTAAVVTSVYDSDTFEFILFAGGKQVDAITDASDGLDPN